MKLVDYDSDQEEPQITKKVVLNLNQLNKMSKKTKDQPISESESEEESNPLPIVQQQSTQNKHTMSLSKPKQSFQPTKNTIVPKQRLPPPPPGMSFREAENLTKSLHTREEKALIEEFDKDDMFLQDQKSILQKGAVTVSYEIDDLSKEQITKYSDSNEKYWELQREKVMQQQEAFMKVPSDVNQLKREKNQIDSLHYQAALKQESFEQRKQLQRESKDKMRARYGW